MPVRTGSDKKKKKLPSAADLRAQSVEELRKDLTDKLEELMRMRFKHAQATLENTASLKTMRRQIAQIETILHEKGQRV